jgi:hypothetical protein
MRVDLQRRQEAVGDEEENPAASSIGAGEGATDWHGINAVRPWCASPWGEVDRAAATLTAPGPGLRFRCLLAERLGTGEGPGEQNTENPLARSVEDGQLRSSDLSPPVSS